MCKLSVLAMQLILLHNFILFLTKQLLTSIYPEMVMASACSDALCICVLFLHEIWSVDSQENH